MVSKAILFTKEDCKPCTLTKSFISQFVEPELIADYLVLMKKENHAALVEAYDLHLFPTLLVVDHRGEQILRIEGGKNIRYQIEYILTGIREATP